MTKKSSDKKQQAEPKIDPVAEITAELQRVQADFVNYRNRVEQEKTAARQAGADKMVLDLLPIIDDIERALTHTPEKLADDPWVKSVAGLTKQVDKALVKLGVSRIKASVGEKFDPNLHQAVQFDEDSEGDNEVIAEELQSGYINGDRPIRFAMVKVKRV